VQVVPVDRDQPRRRLRERMLRPQVVIAVVALTLAAVLAPILGRRSLGPGSSALLALILFGGMLVVVVFRRRAGRPGVPPTLAPGEALEDD
jgi:F0F1-type ATP synthase assembly protein I